MNELIRRPIDHDPLTIPSAERRRATPATMPERRRVGVRDLARDDADDAEDRADREVEDAGDDADVAPQAMIPTGRRLVEHVEQVAGAQERVGGEAERDEQRQEREDDPVVAEIDAGGSGSRWSRRRQRRCSCCVSGPRRETRRPSPPRRSPRRPSNSPTIRPARITSTRCARPSTSSISEEISRTAMPSRGERR